MRDIHRSLAYSMGGNYLGLLLQLSGLVVLSRLLTPTEIGVFSVAAVFSALAGTLRDFGVAEYVIQKRDLTDQDLRAALSVSLLVSWTLGITLFALAPSIAVYFREPGIAEVMRVQALSFALIPFGAVTMAWFRRQMIPRPQFVSAVLAQVGALVAAVAFALNGMGHMSLAWSSLLGVAISVGVSLWLRPTALPRWPGRTGLLVILRYGVVTGGVNALGQLGRSAPELMIGRLLNVESVALFGRANALVEFFQRLVVRSIQPILLPVFARCQRQDGSLSAAYLHSVSHLTVVGWPLLGFLALVAPSAIALVYGPQWAESAALSRVLCAAAALELVHRFAREAMLAHGSSRLANTTGVIQQLLRVLGLLAVIPHGLPGACWGLLAAAAAGVALQQAALARSIGLRLHSVALACLPSLGIALASGAPLAIWLAVQGQPGAGLAAFVALGAIATTAAWALCLAAFAHPLAGDIRALFRRRKPGPA